MIKRIVDLNDKIIVILNVGQSPIKKAGNIDYVDEAEKIANLKNYAGSVDFLIPSDYEETKFEKVTLSMYQLKKILEAAEKVEAEPPYQGYFLITPHPQN